MARNEHELFAANPNDPVHSFPFRHLVNADFVGRFTQLSTAQRNNWKIAVGQRTNGILDILERADIWEEELSRIEIQQIRDDSIKLYLL